MEKNWVCIYSTEDTFKAEIAKEVLFDNGIQAVSINKKDSAYLFGLVELYVDQAHVIRGKHILKDFDGQALNDK